MKRYILTLMAFCSIAVGMDKGDNTKKEIKRRPSLPALTLSSLLPRTPASPTSSPRENSPRQETPRSVKNAKFLEMVMKFSKQRRDQLIQMQERKNDQLEKALTISQELDKPLPDFSPDNAYAIIEQALDATPDNPNPDMVRKVVPNKEYDKKYAMILGISESDRINSGNFGKIKKLGFFQDLITKLEDNNESLTDEQRDFLSYAFGRFKDNHRSSKMEEVKKGKAFEEIGKVKRGFQAIEGLLKDKKKCTVLLSTIQGDSNSSSSSTDASSKRSPLVARKFVHTRERSNSDVR